MDNRGLAMDYYVQALHKSVYCYEALEALVQHEMLMAWEGECYVLRNSFLMYLPTKHYRRLYECKSCLNNNNLSSIKD